MSPGSDRPLRYAAISAIRDSRIPTILLVIVLLTAFLGVAKGANATAGNSPEGGSSPLVYELLDLNDFMVEVEQILDGRFGGSWMIEPGRDAKLLVGVVRPTSKDEARILAVAGEGSPYVRIRPVKYSFEQLLQFQTLVNETVTDGSPQGSLTVGLRTDLNKVFVELDPIDRSIAQAFEAESELPADSLELAMSDGLAASTLASRKDYPPYKGGLDILIQTGLWAATCTSAFTMVINSGLNAGLAQGSTAGHCGETGETAWGGPFYGVPIGTTNSNTFFCCLPTSNGDGQLIGFVNQLDATNLMYVNSTLDRWVNTHVPDSSMGVGAYLCKSGKTTGATCGNVTVAPPVTIYNVTYFDFHSGQYKTKNIGELGCVDANADSGDSGGPVYTPSGNDPYYAGAAGIVSLKRTLDGSFKDMCFDTMDNFTRDTGTHVMTFDD